MKLTALLCRSPITAHKQKGTLGALQHHLLAIPANVFPSRAGQCRNANIVARCASRGRPMSSATAARNRTNASTSSPPFWVIRVSLYLLDALLLWNMHSEPRKQTVAAVIMEDDAPAPVRRSQVSTQFPSPSRTRRSSTAKRNRQRGDDVRILLFPSRS